MTHVSGVWIMLCMYSVQFRQARLENIRSQCINEFQVTWAYLPFFFKNICMNSIVYAQMAAAKKDLYDVFFNTPTHQKMALIKQSEMVLARHRQRRLNKVINIYYGECINTSAFICLLHVSNFLMNFSTYTPQLFYSECLVI